MALKEYPRTYLSRDFNPGNLDHIQIEFKKLTSQKIESKEDMEKWTLHLSELLSSISEEGAKRYVDSTCYTEDEGIQKNFMEFITEIEPKIKPHNFEVMKVIANSPHTSKLDKTEFTNIIRSAKNQVEIYREENIPLQTEDQKLNNEYQQVVGAAMIEFEGKEFTIPQMGKFLEDNDRSRRESAFRATWDRFLKDKDKYNQIYDEQIKLRHQMAKNAGYKDYRDLRFRELERFDYGTKESVEFQDAIAEVVVPIVDEIHLDRKQKLGVDKLRPWDTSVDPSGKSPLAPFDGAEELARKARTAFDKVDPRLSNYFDVLIENKLLDLDSRKGKAPGGYMCAYDEQRKPFIFMNAAGLQRDVDTILHEGGHAFHTIAARDNRLIFNRNSPIEFAEVASMSMELLAGTFLNVFYKTDEEAKRARKKHLGEVITILPWIATIDAFQHWVYSHPTHTVDERYDAWVKIFDRFSGKVVDYSGLDDVRKNRWMRQLHLYGYAFYYIEYGIAQLGALQVWHNYKKDSKKAVESYLNGLSRGNTLKLPELFEAAGVKFDFSRPMLSDLMGMVKSELATMKNI
jgi:oligoendopeptidase F